MNKAVMNDENMITEIRRTVEDILQEDYDGIYDFFLELLKKDYDYIILMSRRCLVLFQLFMRFFSIEEDVDTKSVKVISDQAVVNYLDSMNGAKVVIVDDILIHGRTIGNLYNSLQEKCVGIEQDIQVYMSDSNVDCMSEEIRNKVNLMCLTHKGEWRSLSNRIVGAIFAANEPYTSFVTSYSKRGENFARELDKRNKLRKIEITSLMQKKYGMKSHVYFENKVERASVFRWLSAGEGVRIYWNKKIKKNTVIPYVFVKCLTLKEAEDVFSSISKALPKNMQEVKKLLLTDNTEKDLVEFKMRLVTCILCNVYWQEFILENNVCEDFEIDIDTLVKGFGDKIAKELVLFNKSNISAILLLTGAVKTKTIGTIEELEKILKSAYEKNENTRDIYRFYFQESWYLDEHRAIKKENRHKGLLLESFLDVAEKFGKKDISLLAYLVEIWDNGMATANYVVDLEREIVGCYITPGEQSYKIVLERNPYLMMMLIYVSKIIRYEENETEKIRVKKRIDTLLKLLDEYHSKYEVKDLEVIRNIIKDEKGYLNAWNQSSIIKMALANGEREGEELIEDFIKRNL